MLKVDADEDGNGGDDAADCLRYLVATKSRRPTPEQLRAAYAHLTGPAAPVWDAGEQPLCPRCGGQLFLERYAHEVVRRRAPLKKAS